LENDSNDTASREESEASIHCLLLSGLLDGHGFVLVIVSEFVSGLRFVVMEGFDSFGREVSIALGYHSIDKLLILCLYRRVGQCNLDVCLRRRRRARDALFRFVLGNAHSAGLDGRRVSRLQLGCLRVRHFKFTEIATLAQSSDSCQRSDRPG